MSWTDRAFLTDFIELYESLPALWEIKSEVYHNRNLKSKAYEITLNKLKEVEADASIDSVKKKLNCLRASYRRELKKMKASEKSGAGADEIYVSTLWYFDNLNFLKNHENQKDGVSSLDLEAENTFHEEMENPRKKRRLELDRNKLLSRAVESLENSKKPQDEASALSASWEALYRNLESKQKLFANKVIMEAFYQGALGKLNEHSFKALETPSQPQHITSIPARPPSTYSNYSISTTSTPLLSPVMISSSPPPVMQTQQANLIQYEYIPEMQVPLAKKYHSVQDLLSDVDFQ